MSPAEYRNIVREARAARPAKNIGRGNKRVLSVKLAGALSTGDGLAKLIDLCPKAISNNFHEVPRGCLPFLTTE